MSYASPSQTEDVVSWDTAPVYTDPSQTSDIQWEPDGTPGAVTSLQAGFLGDPSAVTIQFATSLVAGVQLPDPYCMFDQFAEATSLQTTVIPDPYGYTHFNPESIFSTEFGNAYYAFAQSATVSSISGVRMGTPIALGSYVPTIDNIACAASPLNSTQLPIPDALGASSHTATSLVAATTLGAPGMAVGATTTSIQSTVIGDTSAVTAAQAPSLTPTALGQPKVLCTVFAQPLNTTQIKTPTANLLGARAVASLVVGRIGQPAVSTSKHYATDSIQLSQLGTPFAFSYLKAVPLLNPTAIGKPLVVRNSLC